MLIIMKFGGTSVGSAERIAEAANLVVKSVNEGHEVVVVTSAMSGVTNKLIAAAENAVKGHWHVSVRDELYEPHRNSAHLLIRDDAGRRRDALNAMLKHVEQFETLCKGLTMIRELSPRTLDAISGIGEMLCAPLLSGAIATQGKTSTPLEATELIVTNNQFGQAEPQMEKTRAKTRSRLLPMLEAGEIPVITGFIGANEDGVTTTLGRGGSDYSASILGAALDADEIWIWTDVDGVMSANPSEVPEARTLREISYSEAAEMAYYGAKVLHYKTILPAYKQNIPVRILNTFNPTNAGTRVSVEGRPSARGVKAVTSIRNVSLISISGKGMQGIPGIAAKTFDTVAEEKANVLMIMQASSENNICFVVNSNEANRVVNALRESLAVDLFQGHIEDISADDSIAIVAVVGDKMKGTTGISAKVFGAMGESQINVIAISQGSSEVNISLIVAEKDAAKAVLAIHQAFELHKPSSE
ncbi:MAG: aspartate kinase [Acidobacteria bacterium]|nr:aspartate kinase [Acidobacteriota bacterium]MBS1809403.1 aspartate kinase [Acidobacteriota bacterium]